MKNLKIIRMKKCQVKQFNLTDSVLCRGQALIIFLSRPHLVGKDSRYQGTTGIESGLQAKKGHIVPGIHLTNGMKLIGGL
jgi:hypothetical protein